MRKTLVRSFVVTLTMAATTVAPVATHGVTARAAAAVVGPLSVQGNQIVDGNGNPLTLRGIHRDLTQRVGYGTSTPLVSDAEIDAMKAWGANAVRVPVSSAIWLDYGCPTYDANYGGQGGYIDRLVNKINADGMVAIVDLHEISNKTCATPGRWAAPNPSSAEFWSSAGALFANRPLVAFELFNEPREHDDATWQSDEQTLYNAVEATGARNLVIIDADDAATEPKAIVTGHVVTDTNHNIAYAVHPYTCVDPSVTSCMSNPLNHQAKTTVLSKFVPVAASYPIVATEFGWPTRSDSSSDNGDDFYRSTYQFLDSQHPAWGSIAFGWNGTLTGEFHMLSSLAPSYNPNQTGTAVKNELGSQP